MSEHTPQADSSANEETAPAPMKLVIISGLSGAGKSVALRLFEDIGHYCIDNMPIALLPSYVREATQSGHSSFTQTAISVDARTNAADTLPEKLAELDALNVDYEVIFLIADHDALLRRYSETRRKHPLTTANKPLEEAILFEAELLEPIAAQAQITIDTTEMSAHDLREALRQYATGRKAGMTLLFESFGFKHGALRNADFIFDVRCLPNPFWEHTLRGYTGQEQPVIDYLLKKDSPSAMLDDIESFLRRWLPQFENSDRSYVTVAIGCTGGQHRSVFIAEQLVERFADSPWDVQIRHRELKRQNRLKAKS